MPLREYIDGTGRAWKVYDVRPQSGVAVALQSAFQHGWLCFDTATEVRRLAPIPAGWDALTDAELQALGADVPATPRVARPRVKKREEPS